MFSPEIVCSEEFLDMPVTSQALYFHLGMRADDDGFVQPNLIIKVVGSSPDDLKVLLAKRFLLPFESGVVVIKHWLIHNMIRGDRYKPTRFQEEKKALFIKDNKAYTELATSRQPNGNQLAPQVRIGQDRETSATAQVILVKDEKEIKPSKAKYPNKKVVFSLWGKYPRNWDINTSQCKAAENLFEERGIDQIKKALEFVTEYKDGEYFPEVLTPYDLDSKWKKIISWRDKYTPL